MSQTAIPSLQQRLADAQLALHRLQIGQAVVEIEVAGGLRTTFKAADVDKLSAYVQSLADQVAGAPSKRGAIGVIF